MKHILIVDAGFAGAYFCGLECYERWRKQAGAFLNAIR
jgi:hypothetical protein